MMKKAPLFAIVGALFVFGIAGQAFAGDPKWGWGECDSNKTLSVENETLDQSVAEGDGPQSTKPAETTEGG